MSIGMDAYAHWRAKSVRRPGEVTVTTPLLWQAEKHAEAERRLAARLLPTGADRAGPAGPDDALAKLALGEAMRRAVLRYRPGAVYEALELGATWHEVAAALDSTTEEARAHLRAYAEEQHRRYEEDLMTGRNPFGLSPDRYRAALRLLELADDERPEPAEG
ncbi:hypothetical protein [Streptomyces sp. NPDC005805]|uniref:hypothetical protein n=1 Tax=Streptomyces sp. NPDC005805 TaxID=3157068 RepID=UPI0033F4C380